MHQNLGIYLPNHSKIREKFQHVKLGSRTYQLICKKKPQLRKSHATVPLQCLAGSGIPPPCYIYRILENSWVEFFVPPKKAGIKVFQEEETWYIKLNYTHTLKLNKVFNHFTWIHTFFFKLYSGMNWQWYIFHESYYFFSIQKISFLTCEPSWKLWKEKKLIFKFRK